jgi:hypothetical protein
LTPRRLLSSTDTIRGVVSPWSERLAYAVAILRGAMVIVFCVLLVVAPETAMPGSSAEPARSLALMFAGRTILLGIVLVGLAIGRKREGLGWVLLADAVLQVFDTGMALATAKGALALLPAALGALDVWAGLLLLRAGRKPSGQP